MAKIYGTPLMMGGGGGGQNLTLPPMVTNLAASIGDQTITLTWTNPVSDVLAGVLVVYNADRIPEKVSDGTKVDAGLAETVDLTGLTNETLYYIRVFPYNSKKQYQTMLEGATITATPDDFPEEPTDYLECAEISETTEFIIPENGYFRIDAIAAGGTGGNAPRTGSGYGAAIASCGGGGRGGNARSEVALQKGTKILVTISSGSVTVKSNGDMEILATPGGTGGNPSSPTNAGAAGTAGGSSGGNIFNESGISGNPGNSVRTSTNSTIVYGGAGATTKVVQINQTRSFNMFGGDGRGVKNFSGSGYNPIMETSGNKARVFISRGNTNIPSPSAASTLSLTPRNASIEASWTNPEDPESVGTLLVSNPTHEPQDITDGTAVDVAEATSYTLTDLPNDKPTYISLFSYNADKSKYSAAKSNVEIPREVTWADTQDALEQDVEEKTEQLTIVTQEYEAEVKTMASAGISQVKAYCEATSNPPTADVGVFASGVDEWKAGVEYKLNDLFTYQGNMGYVKQPTLTSLDVYPPFSVGTEALYGARPKPDADGIYPYVYNMGIYEGMLVRDDDGVLYRSITGTQERPTELLYHPKYVPTLLEKVEEGGEEAPSEEYPEWVRPTGAHDAYAQGAKVSHNGKKWTSDIAANVWEPGVYGWTEVI